MPDYIFILRDNERVIMSFPGDNQDALLDAALEWKDRMRFNNNPQIIELHMPKEHYIHQHKQNNKTFCQPKVVDAFLVENEKGVVQSLAYYAIESIRQNLPLFFALKTRATKDAENQVVESFNYLKRER
jgi:hypothetical protein